MPKQTADVESVQKLYELAAQPKDATATTTAMYDMMGYELTKADVCDALRDWIDSKKGVVETQMRGQDTGQLGYVIKPTINGKLFYCKFVIRNQAGVDELLVIISAHPDH